MHFGFGRHRGGRGSPSCPLLLMLVPRRVRRLSYCDFLPSGWFATWFLLLLGFWHLVFPAPVEQPEIGIQWPAQLGGSCDGGMLPLTLFPLNPASSERNNIELPYRKSAELDTLRRWHDIEFTGVPVTDFMAFESTIQLVKAILADTGHEGGIRIHFQLHARYSSLAATLDVMNTLNQKRYWLDIRHEPLTLYVVTNKSEYAAAPPLLL